MVLGKIGMGKIAIMFIVVVAFSAKGVRGQESLIRELDYRYLDTLIALAKQNYPRMKILQEQEALSRTDFQSSKLTYLDVFNGSYIYRPRNAPAVNEINPYLINGYQFSVGVNLAGLIRKPINVRQAKRSYHVAQLESEQYEAELENNVKTAYYSYMQSISELKVRTQYAQDSKIMFDRIQRQFEQGEVELETYTAARSELSSAHSAVMQAEVNYLIAKDGLEVLVGIKLENINKG
ncbi:TolC family protein [Parapedobacter sp. GCM10030251]|uniref:TolC family protein n=1 Tax=Parapedobacter sp. GCM10030251 TaxID=3273419 RepID=UPI0036069896